MKTQTRKNIHSWLANLGKFKDPRNSKKWVGICPLMK